jgi:hypothetical protein
VQHLGQQGPQVQVLSLEAREGQQESKTKELRRKLNFNKNYENAVRKTIKLSAYHLDVLSATASTADSREVEKNIECKNADFYL